MDFCDFITEKFEFERQPQYSDRLHQEANEALT